MRYQQKLWCLVLIIALLLLDQWTKAWVALHLQDGQILRVGDYFNLRLAHNTGAAFSLFRNDDGTISAWALWFLIVLAAAVCVGLLWCLFIRRVALSPLRALCYALILSGALGNVIDRIRQHFVVDFFDFHVGAWHYATFNVADCAVVAGVFLLIFLRESK